MTLYILDTDTLTLARYRHPALTGRIVSVAPPDRIAPVNVREIMEGWIHKVVRGKRADKIVAGYEGLRTSTEALWGIEILPLTAAAWLQSKTLEGLKRNVRRDDLRIAAIALDAWATVVTRNLRDFRRVPGLTCEDRAA